MNEENFFFRATPRPDGGFSVTSATGGENETEQVCETVADMVSACEAWATNVPTPEEV